MKADDIFNIMLQSDDITGLCQISHLAQTICLDKRFWQEKIKLEEIGLILNEKTSYLSQYQTYKSYLKTANNIITICEKERLVDKDINILFKNKGHIHIVIEDDGIKQFPNLRIPEELIDQILEQTDKQYYMISLTFIFVEDNIYRLEFLVSTEEEDGQGEWEAAIDISIAEMRHIIISALYDSITNITDLMGSQYIPSNYDPISNNRKNFVYYNMVKFRRLGMLMILNNQ